MVFNPRNSIPHRLNAIVAIRNAKWRERDHLAPVALRLGINKTQNRKVPTDKSVSHLAPLADCDNRRVIRRGIEVRSAAAVSETNLVKIPMISQESVGAHVTNGRKCRG